MSPASHNPSSPRPAADPAAPASSMSDLVQRLVASYAADRRTHHLDATFLPNRDRTIQVLDLLRRLVFPGFFDEQKLASATIHFHAGELLTRIRDLLYEQVREALRYEQNRAADPGRRPGPEGCDAQAGQLTDRFLDRLPELRRLLALDVQAAFDGDPAATSTDEAVFCYPGVFAVFVYRVAHEWWKLQVPLLPRMASEYAHAQTGIDLHPGASIGESFFIDHGTGVVVGETTVIGNRVKLYQGVTLGALSTKGGQAWRGRKRHPTLEDDVTIYGGAIILGGETVIGRGATIGGTVFLTSSVPPGCSVTMKAPELRFSSKAQRGKGRQPGPTVEVEPAPMDFQI